jgi:DNA polymerase-1
MPKKIILIDGNALVHRAYHAIPPLSTTKGEPTNAVFGFTSMLINALNEIKPDYIAVAFDVGRTFRHDEFAEYKAQRPSMPSDLARQFERVRQVVAAFNIPSFGVEGYEADDVLGTLARQAEAKEIETVIVTGDLDALQLVDEHTRVLTSRGHFSDTVTYDEAAVRERYGLSPQQLIEFKALKGDPSDNIPGIPGIGDKTASKLVTEFGTVEAVFDHLDQVEAKTRAKLADKREQALQSKRLATIVTDVPITLELDACRASFDRDKVVALFRELEFRSLLDRLPEARPKAAKQMSLFDTGVAPTVTKPLGDYCTIDTAEKLAALARELAQAQAIAIDTETSDKDAMTADLVGIALTAKEGQGFYIPVGHDEGAQLALEEVAAQFRPMLENPVIPKYAHNANYDLMVLARHGIDVQGLTFDTMIAAYLLDPSGRAHGLKNLAFAKLGVEMTPIEDLIGKGKAQRSMAQIPIAVATNYAGADVDTTHRLVGLLEPELRQRNLWSLFAEVEMPLVPVLVEMETTGVALDVPFLQQMSRELYQRLIELERGIYDTVGHQFNINSTQQLGQVLFEELKLPPVKRTKTGYSTDVEVLEELKGTHPAIDLILEYRTLSKLKSTYVDALPLLVNRRTGRVHTSYNQTGTVTGRVSSSEPNLQNIPIRTDTGRKIRRAFIAAPGHLLVSADYSQVELRILAHISKDRGLLDAFARGEDIHASTAATIFGVPIEKVTPEMRRVAKMIDFGLSYGMSGYGLASRTGLSQAEADKFIASYFASYPGVKAYMERTKKHAYEQGYVATLLDRRRYFPELQNKSPSQAALRRAAEREAINMPIQGSAADILKLAMIRLHRALHERGLKSRMTLQVHDELVLESPEDEVKIIAPLAREVMESAFVLDAPLKADVKVGKNWDEMDSGGNG